MVSFLSNYPLMSALSAIVLAQFLKLFLFYNTNHVWNFGIVFSTGGMPSSHSAAVTSLTTAIGIVEGLDSSLFATSLVFSIIVMFDAAGVRRHAGEHAAILNILVNEFHYIFKEIKSLKVKSNHEKGIVLKELLGHKPVEVAGGGVFGIIVSLVIYILFIKTS